MDEQERRRHEELSEEARAWLADQLRWETRFDRLRRAKPRRVPRNVIVPRRFRGTPWSADVPSAPAAAAARH
jgi:hypothetical protein